MSISEEQVKSALKSVKYPGFTRDIVSFGLVKSIQIDNGEVKVQLALATNDPNIPAAIKNDAEGALRGIEGVRSAKVLIDIQAPPGGAGGGMGATRNGCVCRCLARFRSILPRASQATAEFQSWAKIDDRR